MKGCAFCRIFRGEQPSSLVLENEMIVALLDIHPINPGHTLVIPRRHVCTFTDLNSQEVIQLAMVAQRVAAALKSSVPNCEGVSLSLADGQAAGQEVPHVHLHVIPRRTRDGFGWRRYGLVQDRSELEAVAVRIRNRLDEDREEGC